MEQVAVIIPIYRLPLTPNERISFENNYNKLSNHPMVVIHPSHLSSATIKDSFPESSNLQFESFDDSFFSSVMGYNRLMLSTEFYERFLFYKYILICQLDAYIFSDKLQEWCDKGYDYIGAPWLDKPVYQLPVIKQFLDIKHYLLKKRGIRSNRLLRNKVGNGGLSLRNVHKHFEVTEKMKGLISSEYTIGERHHMKNEDVFFATIPNQYGFNFNYPNPIEALSFSFDKYPSRSLRLTNGVLPFGVHGWWSRKMRAFYESVIPELRDNQGL